MKKFVCTVCGYVYEGEAAPEKCPVCGVGADKFTEVKEGEREWAAEHVVGVAKGVSEDILADLISRFFFVLSVTTSPRSSANLAACSASS